MVERSVFSVVMYLGCYPPWQIGNYQKERTGLGMCNAG
jgi:hypothetical protein